MQLVISNPIITVSNSRFERYIIKLPLNMILFFLEKSEGSSSFGRNRSSLVDNIETDL